MIRRVSYEKRNEVLCKAGGWFVYYKKMGSEMKKRIWVLWCAVCMCSSLCAAEWQWSVRVNGVVSSETQKNPLAFLWIPPRCEQVRAVVVGQHNMTEETILEHPEFRRMLSKLNIAEVWITPGIDQNLGATEGTQEVFERLMQDLAGVSGYSELQFAPVVPIGHSAMATYPWNFAAWNPERTLAVLSVHGDAPRTNLTGYGRPNMDWGNRNIDGIPGLMAEGEFEWWEDRVEPALAFRQQYPESAVSFLCDAGHGHFDISDELVHYLALFVKKAMQYRLPKDMPLDRPTRLLPVDPHKGWLADRWRGDCPRAKAAPYDEYQGNREDAFWYFDREMVCETEKRYASTRNKKKQYLGVMQNGVLLSFDSNTHARIVDSYHPQEDGVTFHLKAVFTDSLRSSPSVSHAKVTPYVTRICGPVEVLNDTTFRLCYYRMGLDNPRRSNDIWLAASAEGDAIYKSTVQQLNIRIPFPLKEGYPQQIKFAPLTDVEEGTRSLRLFASSDSGLEVYYYVKEGPAEIEGNQLRFTRIPPRTRYPVKVTVVAWQYGRSAFPRVQTAEPVERSFYIYKNKGLSY